MIETSDSPVPKPPPFHSMPTTPDTSHSGTKLSLLIVTLITTRAGSKRQRLHPDNINRDSGIEILEAWIAVRQRTTEGANH
ncbi:unnamed protein product [Pocillopora meandrina]|uniref:Uncharacterized protein n=1 Tax=Pocillopora meandrina TaxID=46732 RepID=A0AAU9WWF5_9CNID|nr:unnamed protein product [Pocillopora meandrina]